MNAIVGGVFQRLNYGDGLDVGGLERWSVVPPVVDPITGGDDESQAPGDKGSAAIHGVDYSTPLHLVRGHDFAVELL
ncbi:hypothetical protein [Catellatospora sichuanensis]|uniref:hypothetical protein n=1 Tax=Catellatospora sichuanensis TaxID=1969805 RepID=UPI0011828697|nr:hypothetical protein [Catellatospora sichuanensis]